MGKSLVIVESPAKAKTINKYLGSNYLVKSSVGHIYDLPTSRAARKKNSHSTIVQSENKTKTKIKKDEKTALVNRMGVDPYQGWHAHYEVLPGKEKIVSELKLLAEKAEHIYLATDLDREGEAIAWHLRTVIGGDPKRFSRVVFNEITKQAIQQAFKQPCELNINRVNAQQARRFMDRVVGYMVSPLLWKKIARGLSAGRVQSVAVRLVVEREQDIKTFIPEEYWLLHADLLTTSNTRLQVAVTHLHNQPFKSAKYHQIQSAIKLLEKAQYHVLDLEEKRTTRKPGAPFITSTLQQAASIRLGFSVKKTMQIAQWLYEAGYITYTRTDATHLSQEAITMVRSYIKNNFGKGYLPKKPHLYGSKKNSQEAHEAIRPSDVNVIAEKLKDIEVDAQRLYKLIWCKFVACQMTETEYNSITLWIQACTYQLCAKSRTLCFDGWTKVMPRLFGVEKESTLPLIKVGSKLHLKQLIPSQHFTQPPLRYNESSLVKELEKRGIGRPSTYSAIISTIQDRGYVRVENHRFYTEKIGEIVTNRLKENFAGLMNYDFTACMEDRLDQVANNQTDWRVMLDDFFTIFSAQLEMAEKIPEEGGMRPNLIVITNINCPTCTRNMGIRIASTGVFLSCTGYKLPLQERCKTTINLVPEAEVLNILEGDEAETNALRSRSRCQICSTAMDSYFINNQSKLHICGKNPTCNGYKIETGEFQLKGYDSLVLECNKCTSKMHLKMGRFGKYMGCMNNKCNNTRKILRNGNVAPLKEEPVPLPELSCDKSKSYFVLRDGVAGVFLAANTFPKSRETRAPLVEELARFKHRLSQKIHYLADAPLIDSTGNKTLVRFNKKTQEQYITSEKNGKSTGWCAFYVNGKWIEWKSNC